MASSGQGYGFQQSYAIPPQHAASTSGPPTTVSINGWQYSLSGYGAPTYTTPNSMAGTQPATMVNGALTCASCLMGGVPSGCQAPGVCLPPPYEMHHAMPHGTTPLSSHQYASVNYAPTLGGQPAMAGFTGNISFGPEGMGVVSRGPPTSYSQKEQEAYLVGYQAAREDDDASYALEQYAELCGLRRAPGSSASWFGR